MSSTAGDSLRLKRLVLAAIVSSGCWPVFALQFVKIRQVDLEGASFVVLLLSVSLFSIAGPFAAATLGNAMQRASIGLPEFLFTFYIVTAPMIAFQAIGIGVSVIMCLHSVTVGGTYLLDLKPPSLMAIGALFTILVYAIQTLILYFFARFYAAQLKLAAISLSLLTFAFLVWQML